MRVRLVGIVGLAFVLVNVLSADGQDLSDEGAARQSVDTLIAQAPDHRATLGRLQEAMSLSVSYGAIEWNLGDHAACSNFYIKTGQSLCDAFAGPDAATPAARKVLDQLKSALDKVATSTDANANGWTMRFVFDMAQVEAAGEADRSLRLVTLGRQYLARSQFSQAASAFHDACDCLHELNGEPPKTIPLTCRFSPVMLSNALFGERRYADAASAAEEALTSLPQWSTTTTDIRRVFESPAIFELLLNDLQTNADAHPDDQKLQFLVGYELYFSGRRPEAKDYLEAAVKLDPSDKGARRLIDQYPREPSAPPAPSPAKQPSDANGDL